MRRAAFPTAVGGPPGDPGTGAGAAVAPQSVLAAGHERLRHFRETRRGWVVLAVVCLVCAVYTGACLKRGWDPWDAGTLAQTAERALHGQVPFRDFNEPYSGGLTYLDAFAFRLFGINLFSLRIPLFLFFLAWLPAVYFIARRFATPLSSGLVTLLAVAWSLPNYTEAMPSWYNLFFATWGTLALLRYTETEKRRWLWIAGLCGGLSIVIKITGLYFVAAGLLFFAFREQSRVGAVAAGAPKRWGPYRAFIAFCLALFLAGLLGTVRERPAAATLVHFVLPGACLAALLLWRQSQTSPGANGTRFRALFSMGLPLLAGAFIPVAALLLWYAHAGALHDLFRTMATLSIRRQVQWQSLAPVSLLLLTGLLPAALIFIAACSRKESTRRIADRAAPVLFAGVLLVAWRSWGVYDLVGFSVSLTVPLLGLAALAWLRPSFALAKPKSEQVILIVTVAVLCALIEFPFSQALYFYYVAPLVILAVLALSSLSRPAPRGGMAIGAVAAFYLIVALWLSTPGFLITNGIGRHRDVKMQTLPLARAGGIRVTPQQERVYARLIPLVQEHARGTFIYAALDCPEVYFLSGLRNPTPTLFDLHDPDFLDIPARTARILGAIGSHGIRVVVLRDQSPASGTLPAELRAALGAEFPQSARVDGFEVRWK